MAFVDYGETEGAEGELTLVNAEGTTLDTAPVRFVVLPLHVVRGAVGTLGRTEGDDPPTRLRR